MIEVHTTDPADHTTAVHRRDAATGIEAANTARQIIAGLRDTYAIVLAGDGTGRDIYYTTVKS